MAGDMSDGEMLYVTIDELSRRSGVSTATLHRLKNAGQIPFFQPGGKGARLLFPPDALERAVQRVEGHDLVSIPDNVPQRLAGRRPVWMVEAKERS
jgi:hypothetical protein